MSIDISGYGKTKIRLANNLWSESRRRLTSCHGFDIALYALTIHMGILSIEGTVQSEFQKYNEK